MATATTTPVAPAPTGLKARLELVTDKIDLESKPLYALAGAGDLAVHTVRELPATLNKAATTVVDKVDLEHRIATLRADLENLPARRSRRRRSCPPRRRPASRSCRPRRSPAPRRSPSTPSTPSSRRTPTWPPAARPSSAGSARPPR